MRIGSREFSTHGRTYLCGILNVTPDSFSDGGSYTDLDQALMRVEEMIGEGMDLLDVGGESTRPGYQQISEEEEIDRVVPVLEAVKRRFDIPLSLDTYKVKVAEAGIEAGADLINDIWGLRYDAGEMAALIARTGVACCLMHNSREILPSESAASPRAGDRDLVGAVLSDLSLSLAIAQRAGISRDRILLDPGIGFAKTYEQNLSLLARLGELKRLGFPILLGASRKSVIGLTLDLPAAERVEGTLVTTVLAVQAGCMFVRVHDVKENQRAIRMTEAIIRAGKE